MQVREIMTKEPFCCTPDTGLQSVARMMADHDCGAIPVVETKEDMRLVGMVTDRDITCRAVAEGTNPLELTAGDCMSQLPVSVTPETDIGDCCETMERNQVRRVPVVDETGSCCGIVAQADIARCAPARDTGEVVREVSQPS